MSTSMRVLVTGGNGFVGRHTLRPLADAGFEVHGLAHAAIPRGEPGVLWHQGDLLAPGFAEAIIRRVRPTHLLHLAWETTHGEYWSSPANQQWVGATASLAHAFVESGGRRMVGVGTCAEYDWSAAVCDEEQTPLRPSTPYGAAKAAAGTSLLACPGAAWARLFFVYGPGEDPRRLMSSVLSALRRGQVARCTSGQQRRDFVHVLDCATALTRLVQGDEVGAFNVATGTAVAVRDVVLAIARGLGAEERVAFGAVPDRAGEPPLIVASVARLRALGWTAAYDMRAGVEDMIRRGAP